LRKCAVEQLFLLGGALINYREVNKRARVVTADGNTAKQYQRLPLLAYISSKILGNDFK
jgi:hypothetical protein